MAAHEPATCAVPETFTARPSASPRLPPGPSAPATLQSLRFALRPLEFADECARRFGHAYTVRLLGQPPTVVFADPDAVKEILMGDPSVFAGGEASAAVVGPILGRNSLVLLDGQRHLRERRLMLPPFHGERMQAYGTVMREITARCLETWPIGRPFAIHPHLQAITLDVIMRTVFGVDEDAVLARLRARLHAMLTLANSPMAAFLAIPSFQIDLGRLTPWGRFMRDREEFRAILGAEIAKRRAAGTAGRTDILSMLLDARDESGQPMRDEELFDEMFTLLMAGHETTANGLAWVFYHLLPRADVLAAVRAELHEVAGGGPVEAHHVSSLHYLDAVIKESARLTPVITNVARLLKEPRRIGGWDLPAGIAVSPAIYLTHRRPDLWPGPERFDPERFLASRANPYAFFPFGGGVRRCIGAAFATYETKVVLAEVLTRADLRLAPGYRMRPVLRTVAVGPSRGVPVVMACPPA